MPFSLKPYHVTLMMQVTGLHDKSRSVPFLSDPRITAGANCLKTSCRVFSGFRVVREGGKLCGAVKVLSSISQGWISVP